MQFGVVLQDTYPPGEIGSLAAEVESLGYDYLWLTDSSLRTRDVFSSLTLVALSTKRLIIGTAVTNPRTRHPAITTNAIATVADLAPGRVVFGLGAGDRPLEALGLRPAKVATVRAMIETSRALLAGERVDGEVGGHRLHEAHLFQSPAQPPPIWLAASGPRTLELAGAVADGAIVLAGLFPEGIRFALDCIERGRAAEGNAARPAFASCFFLYGSVDDDVERAIAAARPIAAWFPQTAPRYCELAGMDATLINKVRERYRGGEFQEAQDAAELISDDLVQKFALAGTTQDTAVKVEMLRSLGVGTVALFPLGERRLETVRAFASGVMPKFGSTARSP